MHFRSIRADGVDWHPRNPLRTFADDACRPGCHSAGLGAWLLRTSIVLALLQAACVDESRKPENSHGRPADSKDLREPLSIPSAESVIAIYTWNFRGQQWLELPSDRNANIVELLRANHYAPRTSGESGPDSYVLRIAIRGGRELVVGLAWNASRLTQYESADGKLIRILGEWKMPPQRSDVLEDLLSGANSDSGK